MPLPGRGGAAIHYVRGEIEQMTGGRVALLPDVIVGFGKTRAILHGDDRQLHAVTVQGDALTALEALRDACRHAEAA
jgi:hypothetical protein